MKTLVLYDSGSPVQVAGAAILKHALNPGVTLRDATTGLAGYNQVINLRPINTEQQYAALALSTAFDPGLTGWETCDEFGPSTIGKTGLKWRINELSGKWVVVHNGAKYDLARVYANDADTLSIVGTFTNTPDADTEFKIFDSIPYRWGTANPVDFAWSLLTNKDMSFPMWLLANQHMLVREATTMSDTTHFGIAGYGGNRLQGAYISCELPLGKIYTRKITASSATEITIDTAITTAEIPTVSVYVNEDQVLLEFMFGLYITAYMSDPNDSRWIRLFDETGALKQGGGATYDEVLFEDMMSHSNTLFFTYLSDHGQTIADIPY